MKIIDMKICFYCDSIFTFGGVQRVLAVIAKSLSVHHDITILTRDDPAKEDRTMFGLGEAKLTIRFLHYPRLPLYEYLPCKAYSLLYKKLLFQNKWTTFLYTYSSFPPTYRKILIKALNEEEYDWVIGVHVFPSLFLAGIKNRIRAKTIGWLHNSYDAFFSQPGLWLWKSENRFKIQMKSLDRIVVLTHGDRKLLQEKMGLKATTVYNPLTLEPRGKGARENKKFLAVGRMSNLMKGFDILIEAFSIFAGCRTEWTLDIVGEGPDESFLRSLIEKYGLEKRVTIHPFTRDIQKFYASASVFVLSSRWEGFGLVLLEAMAHGLPVIASDLPVCRELLAGCGCCTLFKSEDRMDLARCLEQVACSEQWDDWSREAEEFAGRFSVRCITAEWEKLLQMPGENN